MKNMIELGNIFSVEHLLLKGPQRDFPAIHELFLDLKLKKWSYWKNQKKQKQKWARLLQQNYK